MNHHHRFFERLDAFLCKELLIKGLSRLYVRRSVVHASYSVLDACHLSSMSQVTNYTGLKFSNPWCYNGDDQVL